MLDVLNLPVDYGLELLLRGPWHVVPRLLEKLRPEVDLLVLLSAQLLVYAAGDLLGADVAVGLDSVHALLGAVALLDESVCGPGRLVEQEGPLDLVLALLVAGRRGLEGHVPAVVVDVAGVAAGVGGLRVGLGDFFVREALLYQKALVLIIEVLEAASDDEFRSGLDTGQRDAGVPLGGLGAEQVLVDLALHDGADGLRLRVHVHLGVEERVLHRVVHLPVLDAADRLAHVGGAGETGTASAEGLAAGQDVLARAGEEVAGLGLLLLGDSG